MVGSTILASHVNHVNHVRHVVYTMYLYCVLARAVAAVGSALGRVGEARGGCVAGVPDARCQIARSQIPGPRSRQMGGGGYLP